MTAADLRGPSGRTAWDLSVYDSLIRWGEGAVRVATAEVRWRAGARRALRAAGRAGRGSARFRSSHIAQQLSNLGQVRAFDVHPDTEVLYGNIAFPVARGRRLPVLWSTQGVVAAAGVRFPEQSARTHAHLIGKAAVTQCWSQHGLAGLAARQPGLDLSRVHVVPPMVYVELPDPWPRTGGDVEALFIGGDGRLKGLDVALEAMRGVGAGLRLSVITDDPPPTDLPSGVTWLGPRPRTEVLARLCASDIHLFPSQVESFGVVTLEAMAAGVAQVLDRAGVPCEVAGGSAEAVDGADPADVRRALELLAGDDALRVSQGLVGVQRYRSVFAPTVVGPAIERLLELAAQTGSAS
jgi:glycosyltransferase involved in cell wall biosynthesis